MFRHDLQHTGSIQAAPSTGNSALRPAHYTAPSTPESESNSTKNAPGADMQSGVGQQNSQGQTSAGLAALIPSQPSLNIARQLDGTLAIEVRCETGRR